VSCVWPDSDGRPIKYPFIGTVVAVGTYKDAWCITVSHPAQHGFPASQDTYPRRVFEHFQGGLYESAKV